MRLSNTAIKQVLSARFEVALSISDMAYRRFRQFSLLTLLLLSTANAYADPTSEITLPAHNASVRTPAVISGTTSGSNPIDRVELRIRNTGGEYWNGSAFQSAWARVSATLSGDRWSYILDTGSANEKLTVTSRAFDSAGAKQISPDYIGITVDTTAPASSISMPSNRAEVQSPVSISGLASDNFGVDRVELIIRNATGSYWNGNAFQSAWSNIAVDSVNGSWSYQLDTTETSKIQVRSRAFDHAGNKQISPGYLPFTLIAADTEAPTTTISQPQRNSFNTYPVTFAGSADDNIAIDRVELIINDSVGDYWNGVSWQAGWASVRAEVTGSLWNYTLDSDLLDNLSVRVRAFDTSGNKQQPTLFIPFTTLPPDTTAPVTAVQYPQASSTVQVPAEFSGTVSDAGGADLVDLVIVDTATKQYWNGNTFQSQWVQVAATVTAGTWHYQFDSERQTNLLLKSRATDVAGNVESPPKTARFDTLSCSHRVEGTATPANSGTPEIIDVDAISYSTGTVISANFFNSGAILDREGRTVSICVSDSDGANNRTAQFITDVGRTDNTLIKAYPEFIVGSKFGLTGETSYRPYPELESTTGYRYPDLQNIASLVGLPAFTTDLPDITIKVDIDETNVAGAERDVMFESWFYDTSANASGLGTDIAGNPLVNTLNNIVGDGHQNPELINLSLEMMVHVGALSPNDASGSTRNPSQHRLTDTPVVLGNYTYHIWHGNTHLAPLVVYSRETRANGSTNMDLTDEGVIELDWNVFLDFTLNDLEGLLAADGVAWATGEGNIFPALRQTGAIGALEFGIEPQTNNDDDQPYIATINQLDIDINGQQYGFY